MKNKQISYSYETVKGIKIFYRAAGNQSKPQLILLNGVPNSSSAFQELIQDLKEDFYLIAPDFPGFGNSDAPATKDFRYTFENMSVIIEQFIDQLGMVEPSVYALGYGGPVAFRIAVRRPDLFKRYVLQNSNAYEEGLGPAMLGAAPFLESRNTETELLVKPLLGLEGMEMFFLHGVREKTSINPDAIYSALYYLSRPGQEEIQLDLLYDYRNNISEYPKWQNFLKEMQPKMLLVWGKNDVFFPIAAAEAIKKDVPATEIYAYDTSHLALEEYHADIAQRIKNFFTTT